MKKEEQIRMLLHPEDYTDEQLDQMLDETDVKVPDTDEEWEKFRSEKREVKNERPILLKIAAMFVGVLMLSGIAYAPCILSGVRRLESGSRRLLYQPTPNTFHPTPKHLLTARR